MELWLRIISIKCPNNKASYTRILKLDKVFKQLPLVLLSHQYTQIKPADSLLYESKKNGRVIPKLGENITLFYQLSYIYNA